MNSLVWIAGPSPAHMVIRNRLMRVNSVAVGRQTSHTVARCARLNAGKSCFGAQCGFKSVTKGHTFTVWIFQKDNTETMLNDTNIYGMSVILCQMTRGRMSESGGRIQLLQTDKARWTWIGDLWEIWCKYKKKKKGGRDIWCITSHSSGRHIHDCQPSSLFPVSLVFWDKSNK